MLCDITNCVAIRTHAMDVVGGVVFLYDGVAFGGDV